MPRKILSVQTKAVNNNVQCSNDEFADYSDEVITAEEAEQMNQEIDKEEAENAVDIIKQLKSYLGSTQMKKDCNTKAAELGVSPKQVAKSYVARVFGVIGDTLGIAVNTVNVTATSLIELLDTILTKAVNIICNVARAIVRMVTFNQTCAEA